tara:strand:- start:285 stop:491 length:207 start_codon:yes stop_codon:yes gene_type:complete
MEYIDANLVFDVSEELIEQWIHKLEGDLSILRGELLRRENGIQKWEWEQNKDLYDKFGLPNINRKEQE